MTHDLPGQADPLASRPAGPVRAWLDAAPADEVAEGLEAAAEPGAALTGLVRLLEAAPRPPARGRVAPLLRLLGGSPAPVAAPVGAGEGVVGRASWRVT